MKETLATFLCGILIGVMISGCFISGQDQPQNQNGANFEDFGSPEYIWIDWTPSTNEYEWTSESWPLEPAIP